MADEGGSNEYLDSPAIDYPSARLAAITRKSNEIKKFMDDGETARSGNDVTRLISELQQKIKSFRDHCDRQTSREDIPTADLQDFVEWRDKHVNNAEQFLYVAEKWLVGGEKSPHLNPEDSVSQAGSHSSRISAMSRIKTESIELELKRQLEEERLVIEEQALDAKLHYEKQQLRLKREKLKLDEKYVKEITRLENGDCERSVSSNRISIGKPKSISHDPLLKLQLAMHLPRNEPPVFDGNITEYKPFLLAFDSIINEACELERDRYYYLLRYTKGYPNDLVKSCLSNDLCKSFKDAMAILNKYYDNDVALAQTYLEKIESWQTIRSEDSKALDEFAIYLTSCLNLMSNINHLNQLNSWKEMKGIVMKLPFDMRKRFRSQVSDLQSKSIPVTFQTLVKFVNSQAECLKLPLFGCIKDSDNKSSNRGLAKLKQPAFSTFNESAQRSDFERAKDLKFSGCPCCQKNNHYLNDCKFFLQKPLHEREKLVRDKKLCFGCLKYSSHRSRDCKFRLSCRVCNGSHPSSLHREYSQNRPHVNRQKSETESSTHEQAFRASSRQFGRILCPSIPVGIKKKGSEEVIFTNMALDTYATACYMDESLLESLNMTGKSTSLTLTTIENNSAMVKVKVVNDLQISSLDGEIMFTIPKLFAKSRWPFEMKDTPSIDDIKDYPTLQTLPLNFTPQKIGLLIGINMPELVKPLDIVDTTSKGPYATKHLMGWALNGPVADSKESSFLCFRTAVQTDLLEEKIDLYFERDFVDKFDDPADSLLDEKWRGIVTEGMKKLPGNSYEIPLPFKVSDVSMPNNFGYAMSRLNSLRRQLRANEALCEEYSAFMDEVLKRGFAEEVPEAELQCPDGKVWFLPHHGVKHKRKNKLRVVYDCSCKFRGISLNDVLLQGPDLTNNLVGVLLRFREAKIAVSADIAKMFYMIKVPKSDSNFLRFLWYPNNDSNVTPKQYRLTVHVFGAKSSPSVANFALHHCLENHGRIDLVRNFYVDDFLLSVPTDNEAIDVTNDITNILSGSAFDLTQFSSNSRVVLNSLPADKLSKQIKITADGVLPEESALGIVWNPEVDRLFYKMNIKPISTPLTKRSVLSTIFSVYDPFNIVSPLLVRAKSIFQKACALKLNWDDPLPDNLYNEWSQWLRNINLLSGFSIDRCFSDISDCSDLELHLFSDGSELAYGSVAYLRFASGDIIKCCVVMAMVRLVPLKPGSLKTIPRIELNSAKLSVRLYLKLERELNLKLSGVHFWSDSSIVLSYIRSENGRFQRFVANRISFIRSHTEVEQWHHVPGKLNPADILSRGVNSQGSFSQCRIWFDGPDFINKPRSFWPEQSVADVVSDDDPEIKKLALVSGHECPSDSPTDVLMNSSSNYFVLRKKVAVLLRLKCLVTSEQMPKGAVTVTELCAAEIAIIGYLQRKYFACIYNCVKGNLPLPRKHFLVKLSPFLDADGLLRARGRLGFSDILSKTKYPIIIPNESLVPKLIVEEYHKAFGHLGRETLMSQLKTKFFIVGCSNLVKRVLRDCLICRKVQEKPSSQFMADLPTDRVTSGAPPFTNTGIDYFGPFNVSKGRGKAREKRYGLICTCLATRSCHLEIAHSLNTDSFICAIRRFISRRGPVKLIRSDNGTNFVRGYKELKESINNWNFSQINEFCKQRNIEWIFNPPCSSHYGGVYEREIRTVRKVLNSLLLEFDNKLCINDEMLSTLMCEVENILNSRPLTSCSADVSDLEALTPNHILRLNADISFPPGLFDEKELHSRKLWRQVQYLADIFWHRWRREYLPSLLQRQKWFTHKRIHKIGDLVLVIDENLPRNLWCLGRIVDVDVNDRGHLRSVKVKVSRCKEGSKLKFGTVILQRSVNKLILLAPVENL